MKPRGPVEAVAFAIAWQRNAPEPGDYTEDEWREAERFVHMIRALQEWDAGELDKMIDPKAGDTR